MLAARLISRALGARVLQRRAHQPVAARGQPCGHLQSRAMDAFISRSMKTSTTVQANSGSGEVERVIYYRATLPKVPSSEVDELSESLLSFGALSCSIEDADRGTPSEVEMFDEPRGRAWASNTVIALFADEESLSEALAAANSALGRTLPVAIDNALDQDWEAAVRAEYRPVEVADGLWIVPSWCERPAPPAVSVVLEPGLAFGTGDHPTTRLCLRWLAAARLDGLAVMDYGCGSGVLAVAALLLGARVAAGVDVDPLAVQSSRANAELNAAESRLDAALAEPSAAAPPPSLRLFGSAGGAQFDALVANILIGPILDLEPRLAWYLRPGGRIAVSGVLQGKQAQQVMESLAPHFGEIETAGEGDWAIVTGVRNAASAEPTRA